MASRGRPTVDPEKVTNLDKWLFYYKKKYGNVVLGDAGEYLVLDPTLARTDFDTAFEDPVKTIPHLKGQDYITILATSAKPVLRAAAEEKREAFLNSMKPEIEAAQEAFDNIEQELLEATETWNAAADSASRQEAALRVGQLSQQLDGAATTLQQAKFPQRYIYTETNLLRKNVDYATHDERATKYHLYRTVLETTEPAQRTLIEEDTA